MAVRIEKSSSPKNQDTCGRKKENKLKFSSKKET
jgi:hypothetical protein